MKTNAKFSRLNGASAKRMGPPFNPWLKLLLAKKFWIIGTKSGKSHLFYGAQEEMITHLKSFPNADCSWRMHSYYSGRIGGTCMSILYGLYLLCCGCGRKAFRVRATSSGENH